MQEIQDKFIIKPELNDIKKKEILIKYIPNKLTKKDKKKQRSMLDKSKKMYKQKNK
jgi:hypothetical protein